MKEKAQKKKIHFEIFPVLIFIATLFMSIVYAQISDVKLAITGQVNSKPQDGVFILDIAKSDSSSGVVSDEIKYYKGTTLSTSIELSTSTSSAITYDISLYNNSSNKYYFKGVSYDSAGYSNSNITYVLNGLNEYVTTISANKYLDFTIQFKYINGLKPSVSQILNSLLKFEFSNEMIEFKVADTTCTAQKGATWKQFIESEYNTYGLKITDNKVYTSNGEQVYNLYTEVKSTDVIKENTTYNYKPELILDKESIEAEIEEGATITETLTATLKNVEGNLTWTSSNTDVAEVVGNGSTATVKLKAEGTAEITVSYGTISATCTVDVTKKASLKIGDKVAYDEGSGYTSSVDSSFVMKDMEWRVLDIEDDGTIELISTQLTDTRFTLEGEDGYLYGPDRLDTLCDELYGNGTGAASARSLKVDDIDKLAGILTDADKQALDENYGMSFRVWDEWLNYTYYSYNMRDYISQMTFDGISMADLLSGYGLNDSNDGIGELWHSYWLSTEFTMGETDEVQLSLFDVNGEYVGLDSLPLVDKVDMVRDLYISEEELSYYVRPVVSLNKDVPLSKVGDTWQILEIELDKKEITLEIEEGTTTTETLTATLEGVEGELTWTSSNTNVASISGSGNTRTITLKAEGTATITVSYGTISATCTVDVTEKVKLSEYEELAVSTENIEAWTIGDGTESNPYIISSKENLAYLAYQVNLGNRFTGVYFTMVTDIDMCSNNDVWIPIGNNSQRYFDGVFQGAGYGLCNVQNTCSTYNYRGIFGFTGENSQIKNIQIYDPVLETEGDYTGVICGYNRGIITGCHVDTGGNVTGKDYVGVIAGYNTGTIEYCNVVYRNIEVTIAGRNSIGAITGYNAGSITGCEVSGPVTISGEDKLGEIAGYNTGTIENCFFEESEFNFIYNKG